MDDVVIVLVLVLLEVDVDDVVPVLALVLLEVVVVVFEVGHTHLFVMLWPKDVQAPASLIWPPWPDKGANLVCICGLTSQPLPYPQRETSVRS